MSRSVVDHFYASFAAGDPEAMVSDYHADVTFEDPVFGELRGTDACDMWRMLCRSADDLVIEHHVEAADDRTARVLWTANYTFSPTGRPVTNRIEANMAFRDGRIFDHRDDFSLWAWIAQALGPPGRLLGWTPVLQGRVRRNARRGLRAFQDRREG